MNNLNRVKIYTRFEAYRDGHYEFPVPPVPTTYWNIQNWIDYIDHYGNWTVSIED